MPDLRLLSFHRIINRFFLYFYDEETEIDFRDKLFVNAHLLIKIFLIIGVITQVMIRTFFFISSLFPSASYDKLRETIYFSLLFFSLGIEFLFCIIPKLKIFKGFTYILFLWLVAKDSYWFYYFQIIKSQPIFASTFIINIIFTFVIAAYWCISWLIVCISMLIIVIFYILYDLILYDVTLLYKLYFILIYLIILFGISLYVYTFEYYLRFTHFLTLEAEKEARQFQNLIANLPIGILITTEFLPYYINKRMFNLFELTEIPYKNANVELKNGNKSFIKRVENKCQEIVEEKEEKITLKQLLTKTNSNYSFNMIRKSNKKNEIFEIQFLEIMYDTKDSQAVIMKDLTDQFNLQKAKLDKENREKIVASFTHDMRNPLMCIIGSLEMMN